MFGISTTPSSLRPQPFSYATQPTNQQPNINNNVNGLLQPPPSMSLASSVISSQPSSTNNLRNYNNTVNNNSSNNISSSYPQKSQPSASTATPLSAPVLSVPPRVNSIPNNSNSNPNNNSNSMFVRPDNLKLRNGHNAGGSSIAHLNKHEVNINFSDLFCLQFSSSHEILLILMTPTHIFCVLFLILLKDSLHCSLLSNFF